MEIFVSLLVAALFLSCRRALADGTRASIVNLQINPSLADTWGNNLLGKQQIADQGEARISFTVSGQFGLWDLRTTDPKGEETEWPGVPLAEAKKVLLSFENDEPVVTYPK